MGRRADPFRKEGYEQVEKILVLGGVGLLLAGTAFAQAPPGRSRRWPPKVVVTAAASAASENCSANQYFGRVEIESRRSDDPKARSNQRKVNDPNQGHGGNSGPTCQRLARRWNGRPGTLASAQ